MKKDSTKNPNTLATEHAPDIATNVKAPKPEKGKLMKKGNTASGGAGGTTGNRKHGGKLTSGARYGISVKLSGGTSPEAGATQSNGRIIAPSINRTRPNFQDGMAGDTAR
jgi:hypothetical protein